MKMLQRPLLCKLESIYGSQGNWNNLLLGGMLWFSKCNLVFYGTITSFWWQTNSNNFFFIICNKAHFNPFPHNDTFRCLWERSLLKILWEKEKLLVHAISPFPTMFSTLSKTEIIIFVTFNLSSANAFNFHQSKNLSSGNGLNILLLDHCLNMLITKKANVNADQSLLQSNHDAIFNNPIITCGGQCTN